MSSVPVQVDGLTGITAVDAGVALKSDGTVWTWQPGSAAAQVSGLTEVTAVATCNGNLALKRDGTVWSWVNNSSSSQPPAPAAVPGLIQIAAIATGSGFCLALKSDLTVWQFVPQQSGMPSWAATLSQVSGLAGIMAVAAAGNTGVALKPNGTVWEWQIGNPGSPNQYNSPPAQVSGLSDVTSIASNGGHRLALKRDGTVWAWGPNVYGQLGNGTTSSNWYDFSPPVRVSGLSGVTAIAAGNYHSLALLSDGTLWAWGSDSSGQLGTGAVLRRSHPVQVRGLEGAATASAGYGRSLVLKSDGTVWQWGVSGPNGAGSLAPIQVGDLTDVQRIVAGGMCGAVKRDGTVWQWASTPQWPDWSEPAPARVEGLDQVAAVTGVGAGGVVLKRDGTVWESCWVCPGNSVEPAQVAGLKRVVAVAGYTGYEFGSGNLALEDNGTVWHWSSWDDYVWGNAQAMQAQQVDGLSEVGAIAQGDIATAIRRDGTVWEWSGRAMPGMRTGVNDAVAIAVGNGYSMALKHDGTVWTWGLNDAGQLGDGTTTYRSAPVQVAGLNEVKAISAAAGYALAVKQDGTVCGGTTHRASWVGNGPPSDRHPCR
jgi:alpha-tubulin suppressor-like RCC1 family protein